MEEEEQLKMIWQYISAFSSLTENMPEEIFIPVLCMTMEEWCKNNNQDITEVIKTMHNLIDGVNQDFGKY